MTYYYAKYYKNHIQNFVWVGTPAMYQNQPLPYDFYIMGSWIGTQIMSRLPPPPTLPSHLHF